MSFVSAAFWCALVQGHGCLGKRVAEAVGDAVPEPAVRRPGVQGRQPRLRARRLCAVALASGLDRGRGRERALRVRRVYGAL